MLKNLMVYEFKGTIDEFLTISGEEVTKSLSQKKLEGFDIWADSDFVIVDNAENKELPSCLINDIQNGLCEFIVRVTDMDTYKKTLSFLKTEYCLYSTLIGGHLHLYGYFRENKSNL